MQTLHRRRVIFPRLVAGAVVLCVFGPRIETAAGSCGDYLHQDAGTRQTTPGESNDSRIPAPCHGPGCRQAPPAPLSTTPAVPTIRIDLDGTATRLRAACDVEPCVWSREDTTAILPSGHPLGIDRPPQLSR